MAVEARIARVKSRRLFVYLLNLTNCKIAKDGWRILCKEGGRTNGAEGFDGSRGCCNVTRILHNASPSQNLLTTLPFETPTYPAVLPDLNIEGYTGVMVGGFLFQ